MSDKSMKNISLSLLVGSEAGTYSLTPSPVSLSFIYGIGAVGMPPLEKILKEMDIGESVNVELTSQEVSSFFGPLAMPFRQIISMPILPEKLFISIKLQGCTEPSTREVVNSMARSVRHNSCGGGCDCGCS